MIDQSHLKGLQKQTVLDKEITTGNSSNDAGAASCTP
jgi:hypothetical protein